MKIAVLGLSLSSSWGNGHATTYRALLRALAARRHRITFYERDKPWYAAARDVAEPDFCRLVLYDSLAELDRHLPAIAESDAVVLGSFVPEGAAVAERLLAAQVRPLAFYDIDTPVTLARLAAGDSEYLRAELIPAFDLYFSFSGGEALRILEERYGARRAVPLYCSVDPGRYRPLDLPKRWDLGYLGTYSDDRQPALEHLLIEPARHLPERHFVVAGAQYPADIAWPSNVERIEHVPPEEHAAFYSSCRFALNVTRSDMIRLGHSPSVRLFEAAACATPVISDRWEGLDGYFSVGREVLTAETVEEMMALLTSLDPAAGVAIGQAALTRVLRDHQASRRAEELEGILIEAAGAAPGIAARRSA